MRQENEKPYREEVQSGAGQGEVCAVSACANQEIVASKWIALEGTAQLVGQHRERLRKRLPMRMIDEAAAFDQYLSVASEAATAMKSGVCGIYDLSQSGIFAGLWEMAQDAGVGLEIDLQKIPVRQETIEICEFCGENPYEMASGGCLLMTVESGNTLAAALLRAGIPAVVIGRTTQGKERVIYHQGRKSYLNKPRY
ncbi:MAG: AIR synthase-related protein [Lachnospiraceae bacterium]|nr:AIR synthase-related protein [Lachnospiraceae bacterium]